jgi:glycosyltransferase involved in cell wall biosynthesis
VTAVSTPAAERFVRTLAVPRKKMSVITNGIDVKEFAPDSRRRKSIRNQMQVRGVFQWLAVGRLTPAKDYPNLLRAFRALNHVDPTARLWIAGEGDPSTLLASHPDLLQNSPSIQWLGLRRDIADLLDAADGFVLSSAWEGMPLVVGEAMAMGKPIVATNVGGIAELMGNTGTLVPPADSQALTAAIVAVMDNNELARKHSAIAA